LPARCVKGIVRVFRLSIGLLAVWAFAADAPLADRLRDVENRYNSAKSLQVLFTEQYTPKGRMQVTDSGVILLRKPLRMRWDYMQPKGKLLVCDGKYFWLYNPAENTVEQTPVRESDDMRLPFAFLLGKLHFEKEFKNIQSHAEGFDLRITAEPKSDDLPYSSVEFVVAPDSHIKSVRVTNFDNSVLSCTFDQERMDPPVSAKAFQFEMPKGAELVKSGQGQ
jgi:outer membrane lipoprotein carrier protein